MAFCMERQQKTDERKGRGDMNILITGGFGFIGMYAAKELRADGHNVFAFDTLSAPPAGLEKEFEGVKAVKGDLLNQMSLIEALLANKIDAIIHLAAFRNNDSKRFPFAAFNLNCVGTMNCFEAARICGIKRVCFASSVAALGTYEFYEKYAQNPDKLAEDVPCQPGNMYGATKRTCEMIAEQYNSLYGMKIVGVRLPIIFGAGKKGGSRSSYYNELIERSAAGLPASVTCIANEKFNIQYVKDSGHAIACGCLANDEVCGIFNTGGTVVTMRDYVQAIEKVFPQSKIELIDDPAATIVDNTCIDSSKAAAALGYVPQFTLEQGIADHVKSLG